MSLAAPHTALGQVRVEAAELFALGGSVGSAGVDLVAPVAVALDGQNVWVADAGTGRVLLWRSGTWTSRSFRSQDLNFTALVEMTVMQPGRVALLSSLSRQLHVLLATDDGIAMDSAVPLPIPGVESLCPMGDAIFLLATARGRQIHEMNGAGELTRSFGQLFSENRGFHALNMGSKGRIMCFESESSNEVAVIAASEEFGVLHAYSSAGVLAWRTTLPRFRPIDVSFEGGAVFYRMPAGGVYDVLLTAAPMSDNRYILVQTGEMSAGARKDRLPVASSYIVDRENGAVVRVVNDLPRISALEGRRAGVINFLRAPHIVLSRIILRN